ncbi:hypothetical protein ACJMK2_033864 [Sinanodonta woodiana]|uniref:Cadherin domain-containing protein n=1 Tax=Sinanodonta woodiana TaxID=1069815 RepID=A0ABD3WR36_SINWO
MGWSFGFLTFILLLAHVRGQAPCSMNSTITVMIDEGNVTANQTLNSTSPYQAPLPVTGTLGGPDGITLTMISDNPLAPKPNDTFRIEDIGTGTRIRLITSVDRDGPDFTNLDDTEIISFRLQCIANNDTSKTAYATVNVNIQDVNDNSPQFFNTPYSVYVDELTPVGTTVYRSISALDKDRGGTTIDYRILLGNGSVTDGSRKFIFNTTRIPNLVINQSLDFEPMYALGQTTYVMTVIATDLGTPPLSSVTQVNVTITDSDDMAPAFIYANCLLSGIYCVDPRYSTSVISGQITNPLIIYPLVGFTRQTATTIRAVDRDTLRSPLSFRIAGTSPVGYENYFSIAGSGPVPSGDKDVYTATLTQLQVITRTSTLTRVEVYILAIQANGRYEERATVIIELDVPNSNSPTVTTATGVNTGYIYENSRLGQNVLDGLTSSAKPLQLIATDPDDITSGQKTAFNFSVIGTGLFNVDYNGYIYLASGNLDYETTKSATFTVRVTETNTAERRFTDVSVTILVLDLNDNDPVFISTGAVHVSVLEGDYTLLSRFLAQVNATDADSGNNGLLAYSIMSIEPAVPSGFFAININTGVVSLSGRVTYPSDYVVVVKASDSAVPPDTIRSATKNMYVNITSAGSNAPQIPSTLYTVTISEGTVPGTSIFTIPATDPDGQVLSYTITAGNAAGKFSIDSSGQLVTIGILDREVIANYSLTVTVRDTTVPLPLSATTTVSVILTDINDNNPVFPSQYQFNVLENQPAGTSVGTVTATDADQPGTMNSKLTYKLNPTNNFFFINLTTGQITTLQMLDYESQSQYIFEVLAVDLASDSRTGTVSVTVSVIDVQDSVPLFTQQIFTANVAEGNANAFVVFVSAVDADAVDNIQYRFLSPATATTFNINSASGQINTAIALDYETQRFYEFYVTTADGQGSTNPSSTATVRVTVLDRNDNSPALSLSVPSVQVFEDAEINRVLVTALATDADAANTSNSEIRFSIVSVSPSSGSSFFSIDRDNGQLVIERSLTNDTGVNQYQITISASDRGTPVLSSQATFTVTVFRNTAPLLVSNSILVNINHTIAPATVVTFIQAFDNDPGDYGRLNYLLLGDSIASRYFQLVPAGNGVNIVTIDQLTKDTARSYYLTITIKDNAGIVSKTATATVTVNVNRNLHDPRWLNLPVNLQTTISITENDPLGQAVLTLSAEDLDILSPDNQVEFRLTGNTQAQNYFKIDSIGYNGVISLIRSPVQDRTINQFTVTVSLTDKGVPPRTTDTATLFVNVLRNEHSPVYFSTMYSVQLREGVLLGTSVIQVSATDSDTNSNFNQITYRIIGDDTAPNFFTIVSSGSMAGWITTSGNLASDSTDTFRIRIEATDNGAFLRKDTAMVYVKVLRNLNRPQWTFNQFPVFITENQNVDTVIYTLPLATDSDFSSPDNITNYRLTSSIPSQGQNYYQVNAATGIVTIRMDLTRDPGVTSYRLTFQAYDLGTPSLTATQTFTLTVNVYRNNRPVFNPSIYSVSVDETRNVNSNILMLSANDIDTISSPSGVFGQLNYSITNPASAKPYFMIVVDNGLVVLRVASSLVNAPLDRYMLLVQVTDDGGLSDYAEITIDIRRNLNAPQFTQTSYVGNITEDLSAGSDINITIFARDADLRDDIVYQLIKDNRGAASLNFFYIERNTGNLFLRRPLTGINTTEFEFTVGAIDSGRPPRETDVNVTIRITHLPAPVFIGQSFSTTIREDVANNTYVISVNAAIQRTSSSGQIVYEAIGQLPAMYYFSIDRFTGDVIVQRDLRRDRSQSYTLTVKAYDTATPSKFATQDISITVLRNVNSPQFDRRTYFITISDDDPLGRLVISLNATDKDPDVLVYSLTGDQRCQQVFYLTSSTSGVGNLYLGTNLLSTTDANFNCEVTVTDNGYPTPNFDRAQVVVTVARRQPPAFNMASYSAETSENVINTTVVRVQASSTQTVGRIAYRTEGIYPADVFFLVDELTGEVRIRQDLRADSLRFTTYTLRVVAYDTAKPLVTGTALVSITVNRNLNGPVIRPPTVALTVWENTDITFWGYRVNVTDPDSKNLACSIIGNAKALEYFKIEPDSCLIKMKNSLLNDPDKTAEYRIQVQVSDDGMPPNTVTGEIIITVPRDRINPGFTNLPDTKTIDETLAVGSIVYNIGANDGDLRGKLVYQLDGYLPAETFFAINSTTGVITVHNSPNSDVLERGSYTLHVCVYDDAWPSNRVCSNLTVVVNRNPNGPQFSQRSYNANIRANFPPGSIVIQMTAQDLDGDKLKFTSEASAAIQNIFYVNPDSGSVILIGNLMNITTIQVYQFNVAVTDGRHTNPKTDRVAVTVSFTPLQGPPVFSNSSVEITIPLTQSTGSTIYTLLAQDADKQGFIQYRLFGFLLGQEYFAVNLNTGDVTLKKALTLNPDKVPSYVLLIEAYDSVEPGDKNYMTLIIRVNRNLNAPEFGPTSYTASVKDYDPIGTSVTRVSAQDRDITEPENNVIYRIDVGRAGGNEYFRIDSNTGLVTINNQLYQDTARPTQYTLYVLATDPSYNPKTATATVFVTVERNVAPTFNPNTYSMSVSEATPLFNPIITVFATDANPKFTVQVNDKGIPSMFDRASVRLTIIRIGKPTFPVTEYSFRIDENTPLYTTIIQMQASDQQSLNNLIYEIRGDGLAPAYFEINNITGVIRTTKLFTDDNNKTPSYAIRVFAYRQNNPLEYAEALVYVTVIRNPSAPTFLHGDLTLRIPESQQLSVAFGKVNATDPDVGTNGEITYSIAAIDPTYASSYFFVNPNTGTLILIGNLMEDPSTPQYLLTVVAMDNGAPNRKQAQVRITVIVTRNPNPPIFQKSLYTVYINENVPTGSDVVQVNATDKDNDKVFYKMEYNPPTSEYFRLNNNTGSITTATELWRDRIQSYTLKITASDNTAASKTSTATVSIIVNRNTNPPVFKSNQYEKRISEYTDVRASIIRVEATDGDNPNSDSGRLRYSINATVPSVAASYFTISPTFGEINLARTLTTDEIQDLSVQISAVAQDISESPKFAQTQVRIFIIRNQYAPRFVGGNAYTVSASDTLPVGYTLLTVTATDNDTNIPESANTPSAEVEYQIVGDANSFARYFHVRQNGEVYVAQSLIFSDKRDSVSVTIRATDKSWKPRYTDATLTVKMNYTVTQGGQLGFTQPEWIIDVFENQASGDLKILDVEGQETFRISCSIISGNIQGNGGPVFSIRRDDLSKNCIFRLMTSLDFETQQRYDLRVKVTSSITKRQTYIFNTWPEAKITVMVLDVNDNRPTFVFPQYPPFTGLQKKYVSAISLSARVDQSVFRIIATDADTGDNGNVTYHVGDTMMRFPIDIKTPFSVNPVDGVIVPTGEFAKADNSPRTFRFEVLAQDNPKDVYRQEKDTAEVVINLIEDKHRFVLVLKGSTPDQVLADKESIRRAIQSEAGLIAIIETIEQRRILQENKQIITMPTDTDIVFVLSQLEPPNFPLIENSDPKIATFLANNRVSALLPSKYSVDKLRMPYTEGSELQFRITKSYVWWLDDPWAALIAITAISILLCMVGLVFIIFTHARYEKYLNQYRVMQTGYERPEFVEPPSFLREYETQSLQMYMPPDEAVQGTDTLALDFGADEDIEDTEGTGAINPVFHDDEPHEFHHQRSEFPEGTTML